MSRPPGEPEEPDVPEREEDPQASSREDATERSPDTDDDASVDDTVAAIVELFAGSPGLDALEQLDSHLESILSGDLDPKERQRIEARLAEELKTSIDDAGGLEELMTMRAGSTIGQGIPESLHSVYESGPFKKCVRCEQPLRDADAYQIMKAYRGTEVIFEMAMCHHCAESQSNEISEASLEVIDGFMEKVLRFEQDEDDCQGCGRACGDGTNFSLTALCRRDWVLSPIVRICETCDDNLQKSLSRETRDSHDRFVRDHFPGVPESLDFSPLIL